jgi:sporulation protein YlmC with PRC-barrel domain
MPITESDLASLSGGNVVTTSGDKIGSIGQIYLDDQTGEPSISAATAAWLPSRGTPTCKRR